MVEEEQEEEGGGGEDIFTSTLEKRERLSEGMEEMRRWLRSISWCFFSAHY